MSTDSLVTWQCEDNLHWDCPDWKQAYGRRDTHTPACLCGCHRLFRLKGRRSL